MRLDIMIQPADTAARVVHKHCRKNAHFRGGFESTRAKFDANPTVAALKAGDGGAQGAEAAPLLTAQSQPVGRRAAGGSINPPLLIIGSLGAHRGD